MSEGITPNLLWVSLLAAAVGVLILSRILSYGKALLVACVRVSIHLIYFSWFFDGVIVNFLYIDHLHRPLDS